MPAVEVANIHALSHDPERLFFKSHKTLPRREDLAPVRLTIVAGQSLPSRQDGETKDIQAVVSVPTAPMTPPRPDSGHTSSDEASSPPPVALSSAHPVIGLVTPTLPQSPLTPDITPPRITTSTRPTLTQSAQQSSLSSQTESFWTARETLSSDEETDERRTSPRSNHSFDHGAENDLLLRSSRWSDHRMPVSETFDLDYLHVQQPVGARNLTDLDNVTRESNSDETLKFPLDKMYTPPRDSHKQTARLIDSHALVPKETAREPQLSEALLRRKQSSRDRPENAKQLDSIDSMDRSKYLERPSADESVHVTDSLVSRAISGLSITSTVEALIIESPHKERTLRHAEKRSSLRSDNSPVTRSASTVTSAHVEPQHRLTHNAERITDFYRKSIAMCAEARMPAGGQAQTNHEVIPVVVIPQRRSSLKSYSHTSSGPSQSGSRRSSRRNPTGPERSRASSLDSQRQEPRIVSEFPSRHIEGIRRRGRDLNGVTVSAQSSSLSTRRSKNDSRTTSLTTESLRQHNEAMETAARKHRFSNTTNQDLSGVLDFHPEVASEVLKVQHTPDLEEGTHLRPPSLPFTHTSIQSSSPGAVEISEATAVCLFPHNNKSLLLVDQKVLADSRMAQTVQSDFRTGLEPQTPEMGHHKGSELDSLLKRHRMSPNPAAQHTVSSTAMEDYGQELCTPAESDNSVASPVRRFASALRAWSGRSGPQPWSDSLTSFPRSLSLRSVRHRKLGKEVDSKLSPLRPRGFWDDFPEFEDELFVSGQDSRNSAKIGQPQYISNSLGMPQQRIIFQGPPSLVRRSPEMRRLFNSPSQGKLSSPSMLNIDIVRGRSPLYRHRSHSLPRWLLRIPFPAIRNLRLRLRRARQRREETKRVARRDKLKQSIGDIFYVDQNNLTCQT